MSDWPLRLSLLLDALDGRALVDAALLGIGALVLYRSLLRTETRRIALGLALAGSVLLLASALRLQGVMWVYRHLSQVVLIAVIVIFQPELRRIFERTALLGRRSPAPGHGLADLLAEALVDLGRRRWGAILVLPGREPIDGWVSGGVTLGAEPSVPLLLSLFDSSSPGHDGAACIIGGRIERFGLRLPLSRGEGLPPAFGTRHNAALGLSQMTDAFVLTVSEERGTLSAFSHGEMVPLHGAADVSRAITEHWVGTGGAATAPARAARRVRRPFELAAALAVGVLVWAAIVTPWGRMVERSFGVPVEFRTPDHLALVGEKPASVTLFVSGTESAMRALDVERLRATFDLLDAEPGRQTLVVTDEAVRLPPGVRLLDVRPAQLEVALGAIRVQTLAIRPQLVGKPPEGFEIREVLVRPDKLPAIAAGTEAGGEEDPIFLTTTPIYVHGVTKSTRIQCKIIAPANLQPVGRRWPDVEVELVVAPLS